MLAAGSPDVGGGGMVMPGLSSLWLWGELGLCPHPRPRQNEAGGGVNHRLGAQGTPNWGGGIELPIAPTE